MPIKARKPLLCFWSGVHNIDNNMKEEEYQNIAIKNLYPHLDEEQLREAEETIEQYLELVLRIYERTKNDPKEQEKLSRLLTDAKRNHTIES